MYKDQENLSRNLKKTFFLFFFLNFLLLLCSDASIQASPTHLP